MEKYKTKSIVIGRMKRKDKTLEEYPCFISFFDMNDPHKSGQVPKKIMDFDDVHKVIITGCEVNYLLAGNDIVINNLESVEIGVEGHHILVNAKQRM